ncbi:hypothetical protein [Roseivivax sp. CAU 1761]
MASRVVEFPQAGCGWPDRLPRHLELRLLDALSHADCSQHDVWDKIRDWLEMAGVIPTEHVLRDAPVTELRPVGSRKYS